MEGGIAEAIHEEWQSTDGPGTVRVTLVYGDTLTLGGGVIAVAIHGWSGDCQSNSGVRGYSNIRGGGGGIAVAIHGEWQSTDGPGSVKVTTVFRDTLT